MDDILYERIEIPTKSPFVLTDVGRRDASPPLKAELYRPANASGPLPAVVISEGLGGVKVARERRYGRFLAQCGFAAVVMDTFATRGYARYPDPVRALNVTEAMMLADNFAALTWLAGRDDIDANRIYDIGFSYGGMICILTAYEQLRRTFIDGPERFAAHVSYYGPTVPRLVDYRTTGAPVAIMNGSLDNNLNPERLDLIVGDLTNGGSAVENFIFEGGYHQWDSDDHEERFDRFNLHDLAVRIEPDNCIFDERSGRCVTGFASRAMMIARNVSLRGFTLKRDVDLFRRSDDILLRYLTVRADEHIPVGARVSEERDPAGSDPRAVPAREEASTYG
jgi:dienelactone hydrolase